jgi:hypothetical protein
MAKRRFDRSVVFRAVELFVNQPNLTIEQITESLNAEILERKGRGMLDDEAPRLLRENFYRLLRQAREYDFIELVAPLDESMPIALEKAFNHSRDSISVVDTLERGSNGQVAVRAAKLTLQLLKDLRAGKPHDAPLTIGLGPGRATLDFCRHFGRLLESEPSDLTLRLVAISAGAPARQPEFASSSFYNLFPKSRVKESVGFFAETLVACSDFERIQGRPGISEVFKEKGSIDVVVTSMGDLRDPHDLLGMFLNQARKTKGLKINGRLRKFLDEQDRHRAGGLEPASMVPTIASVQYRLYDQRGPLTEVGEELRSCTIFELSEFTEMVRNGGHVVLIARQCGACGMSRGSALHPLFTVPTLKVWSHVVMDAASARDLLACASGAQSSPLPVEEGHRVQPALPSGPGRPPRSEARSGAGRKGPTR